MQIKQNAIKDERKEILEQTWKTEPKGKQIIWYLSKLRLFENSNVLYFVVVVVVVFISNPF